VPSGAGARPSGPPSILVTLTHDLLCAAQVPEAAIQTRAEAAGIGQGKLQGDIGNFIALIKVRPYRAL
jgi:hypothetical protein